MPEGELSRLAEHEPHGQRDDGVEAGLAHDVDGVVVLRHPRVDEGEGQQEDYQQNFEDRGDVCGQPIGGRRSPARRRLGLHIHGHQTSPSGILVPSSP